MNEIRIKELQKRFFFTKHNFVKIPYFFLFMFYDDSETELFSSRKSLYVERETDTQVDYISIELMRLNIQ